MVEQSIREILPQVMNEVLLRTIAGSGVLTESRPAPPQPRPPKAPARTMPRRTPSNLREMLDDSAGAEFYSAATDEDLHEERFEERHDVPMRERIQALPPELQHLAEDIELGDGDFLDESVDPRTLAPPLEQVGQRLGLDFTKMSKFVGPVTNKQPDRSRAQFEEARIKRMREQLNDGKPVE